LKLLLCGQSQLQGFQNACKGKPLVIIDCLKLLLIKRNHVNVTKVCKESCNTGGAKGYWHFYGGANTCLIAQILSRERELEIVNVK
jgi:hypothetical protein